LLCGLFIEFECRDLAADDSLYVAVEADGVLDDAFYFLFALFPVY
jgi:hypothetical protein